MPGSIVAASDWSIFDENSWLGVPGLLALAAGGLIARLVLQMGPIRFRHPPLSAFALAYLAGGPTRVTQAALAGLRAQGSLAVSYGYMGGATLQVNAPPPHADPVELAVCAATSTGVRPWRLADAPAVVAAAALHADQLRRNDLLLPPRRRRAARIVGVVGGICAVLVGSLVFLVGLAMIFVPVSDRPLLSRRALARHRRRHPLDPTWPHRGPAAARMAVALYGDEAVLAGDPDLARALGIRRAQGSTDRGGDDSGSCGSGDGGGDGD